MNTIRTEFNKSLLRKFKVSVLMIVYYNKVIYPKFKIILYIH